MEQAYDEYIEIIRAVSTYECVIVLCREEDKDRVARNMPQGAMLVVHPIDDGWIRDNGPLAVRSAGSLVAVDFGFNSWGGRFAPWDGDSTAGETLAHHFNVPREPVPFVLEGGAISFNGGGTALVVEECVLHLNRNGDVSRGQFEALVSTYLGVDKVIWLPFGLLEDLQNTDGHVDNLAVFVAEDRVLAQVVDRGNPNYDRLLQNLEVLRSSRNSHGEPLNVEIVASLPYAEMPDDSMRPVPYLNFAITNGSVLVPSIGSASDDEISRLIGDIFPERTPTLVPSYTLTHGGGGPHCITMQWPEP